MENDSSTAMVLICHAPQETIAYTSSWSPLHMPPERTAARVVSGIISLETKQGQDEEQGQEEGNNKERQATSAGRTDNGRHDDSQNTTRHHETTSSLTRPCLQMHYSSRCRCRRCADHFGQGAIIVGIIRVQDFAATRHAKVTRASSYY